MMASYPNYALKKISLHLLLATLPTFCGVINLRAENGIRVPPFAQSILHDSGGGYFGYACSQSGDTLAIGSYSGGSVKIYTIGQTNLAQQAELSGTYSFGRTLSLDGNRLAVGASGENSVYIYDRNGTNWQIQAVLDGANGGFGSSVALKNDILVAGAPSSNNNGGRADVYEYDGTNWNKTTTFSSHYFLDALGSSVATDGENTVAVGAPQPFMWTSTSEDFPGYVNIYERNGDTWDSTLLRQPHFGNDFDQFGFSLAIHSNLIAVGQPAMYEYQSTGPGRVYLFERNVSSWELLQQLSGPGGNFGLSVSLSSDRLVVGKTDMYPLDDLISQGSTAFIFEPDEDLWNQTAELMPSDNNSSNWYGCSVTHDSDTVFIGAARRDDVHFHYPGSKNADKVIQHIKPYLYREDAGDQADQAAFRYLDLLYEKNDGILLRVTQNIDSFYGDNERTIAGIAKEEIIKSLNYNPMHPELSNLLLDICYHTAIPELICTANLMTEAGRIRITTPASPFNFIIDEEIAIYTNALEHCRAALKEYLTLLTDDFGNARDPSRGYRHFRHFTPLRGRNPMNYLTDDIPYAVNSSGEQLFDSYNDLVALYEGLRDYGRVAATLARLTATRDEEDAGDIVTEALQYLYLNTALLKGIFPNLDDEDPALENTGLAELSSAIHASISDLENLNQALTGEANLLGFSSDFLMLTQKISGPSADIFDSFDIMELRLNPTDLSSPLRYATELCTQAAQAYETYAQTQVQLEAQLNSISTAAEDRLYQIVGAYPDTQEYETPGLNQGSEIWQQKISIELAQLQIRRNKTDIEVLEEEIRIEEQRTQDVQDAMVRYGDRKAKLAQEIGYINAAQAYANEACAALDGISLGTDTSVNLGALLHPFNAYAQAGAEVGKGFLEGDKEQLAAQESAEIEGIESAAKVETLLLGMKTLAIDSLETTMLLRQEVGRLAGLLREKKDLESTLDESGSDVAERYFSNPAHHLRYQHETMMANLSFDEAQKWLFFMARALEYKWNTPFMNYFYLGRKWSTETLFELRNADELKQFYNAMVSFNSQIQLPQDDYFDWFSVREDFLGYYEFDETGTNRLYYADPADPNSPSTLTAKEAFRSYLITKMDAIGNIRLKFSTRREIPGGTFYRGPRYDENRAVLSAGLFLDKIKWLKINLPGSHTLGRTQLAGELSYGGTGFIRSFDVGTFHPERPDRLQNEEKAYSTRYWYFHAPSAKWRFSETLKSPVTMQLSSDPRVPPTVNEIDIFKERSVATTGWDLAIPTTDLGISVLNIGELDDIELYFYHYAVSRQMPESPAIMSITAEGQENRSAPYERPFPYNLPYEK